jgi:rfaE bifunctional protein nucleotidyltransferase chain/domain
MITPLADLVSLRADWRWQGRRVVFTNGCFDLLHPGHVRLLQAARAEGDLLVVAINTDRSVTALKGAGRPVIPERERGEVLQALESVDHVLTYDDPTPAGVIAALVPDVLVKGADWALTDIVGRDVVEAAGGRVIRVELLPGRSTTDIVVRVRRS